MTIKEARKQVGLTQKNLSDWLGIPRRTIENWDSGKNTCPEWCEKILIKIILNKDEYDKLD